MSFPYISAILIYSDLDGRTQYIQATISFENLRMCLRSTDGSNSIVLADVRISQGTSISTQSDPLMCAINDKGTTHVVRFGDVNSLQTFISMFEQTKQKFVRYLNDLCKLLANTEVTVPDPFLSVTIPLLYCNQRLEVEQEICNIHWFFVNLSPEYKLHLRNLIKFLMKQSQVTPEIVKPLTDLESSLSKAVEDMDPFSYADIRQYYSNWVVMMSQFQGTVYQAVDNLTKKKVAVKEYKNTDIELSHIKNEIRSLYSLRDLPSIVHLIQGYYYNNTYYLVEELMQGMTLLDYVNEKGPLTEQNARIVMRVLLETLRECHRRHIIHRDIKLDNVMFRTSENRMEDVVLLDFGLSIFAPADLAQSNLGTEEYLSPDILSHSFYSEKTDMWSLGVLFYGLVTGLFPFGSHNDENLRASIQMGSFARGPHFSRLSPNCQDFINQLLQVDATIRYSAEQALNHPWMQNNDDGLAAVDIGNLEVEEDLSRVSMNRSRWMVRSVEAIFRILRPTGGTGGSMQAIEVHMTPGDTNTLFRVDAPLEVRVASVSINWDTNEMWIRAQENIYYNNQPDRIEGKWILCQRGCHSPYAMDKQLMLFRGVEQVPLFVLPSPEPGRPILTYPTNHYVIIKRIVEDRMNTVYGEISEQSMLVFTKQQDKQVLQLYSGCYLTLQKNGVPNLNRLI